MPNKRDGQLSFSGVTETVGGIRAHLKNVTLADIFDKRVAGFACILAWQFITFFSTTIHYSTRNDISHFNSVVGFASLGMIAVMLLAAIVPSVFSRCMCIRAVRWAAPLLVLLSSIVLVAVEHVDDFQQPWCSIASTVAGVGVGALFVGWSKVFARMDSLQVMAKSATSFLLSAVIFALVVALPLAASIVCTVLLPLLSGLALYHGLHIWSSKEAEESSNTPFRAGAFSISAVLSLGVLAWTGSFAQALLFDPLFIIDNGSYPWFFIIGSVVAVVVICAPMLSSDSLDFAGAYRSSVFTMGLIFLLVPIVDSGTGIADALGLSIYCVVLLLTWVVLARITGLYQLPVLVTFGIGWSALVSGSLAGTFIGGLLRTFVDMTPRLLSVCTLVCVVLLFFAYLFLFTEKSMAKLLGGSSFGAKRPFHERGHQIALDYGLTKREEETMMLIAKGRTNARICEELGVTPGTVNSHLSNLYKKLDVHDRQEVIDLVEQND
ncbi:LuxR C-terminal-related transcriptional regulator [Eggerthellaceae bacterium 3-80]|nr:DNA-binding response regulator [bacterium D16-34]